MSTASIQAQDTTEQGQECPICLEEMTTAQLMTGEIIFLPCVQKIHTRCFWRYVRHNQHRPIICCPCTHACGVNIRTELQGR